MKNFVLCFIFCIIPISILSAEEHPYEIQLISDKTCIEYSESFELRIHFKNVTDVPQAIDKKYFFNTASWLQFYACSNNEEINLSPGVYATVSRGFQRGLLSIKPHEAIIIKQQIYFVNERFIDLTKMKEYIGYSFDLSGTGLFIQIPHGIRKIRIYAQINLGNEILKSNSVEIELIFP